MYTELPQKEHFGKSCKPKEHIWNTDLLCLAPTEFLKKFQLTYKNLKIATILKIWISDLS